MINTEKVLTGQGVGNMQYEHLQPEGALTTFCGLAPAEDQAAERARRQGVSDMELQPCPACKSLLEQSEALEAAPAPEDET